MKHLRLKEILCVLVLAAFIFAVFAQNSATSDAAPADVGQAVFAACGLDAVEGVAVRGDKAFKKEFGLDPKQFDGGFWAASNDVMEVRELLIVRLKDGDDGRALTDALRKRVEDKIVLFEGYAAAQTAQLKSYRLVQHGNFILFAVCDAPADAVKVFRRAL